MPFSDIESDISTIVSNNTIDIPFYTDYDSLISDSTYCFDSVESMELFKKSENNLSNQNSLQRMPDGQFKGVPMFQCMLKKDKSYLLNDSQKNLVIYKYIVIPTDNEEACNYYKSQFLQDREVKFVSENKFHNVAIFKIEFAKIKNEGKYLSANKKRVYTLKFKDDILKMTLECGDDNQLKNAKIDCKNLDTLNWDLTDKKNSQKNVYKLISQIDDNNKDLIGVFDSNKNNKIVNNFSLVEKDYLGNLRMPNVDYEKKNKMEFHDNEMLSELNEKIVAMTYVLITYKRYRTQYNISNIN
ncbi:hypothetical protein ACO0SA_001898 [Hanseniaspora valbyensis]